MRIEGITAMVTGATRGIGRALTLGLAARGAARIVAVGRDVEALRALAAELPGVIEPLAGDLAEPDAVAALAAAVRERAPTLGLLINNAGVQNLTDFMEPDLARAEALAREIGLNFTGVVLLTDALLPLLMARPAAAVVNVTSGLALAPKSSAPVYCATKAAVRSFTMALAHQARARAPQLRVIEALPPMVDTAMTAGRGRGKISPEACAAEILDGVAADKARIYVGASKLLRAVHGLSPSLAARIMRGM
jgi:uncharacterized oxidoreductase